MDGIPATIMEMTGRATEATTTLIMAVTTCSTMAIIMEATMVLEVRFQVSLKCEIFANIGTHQKSSRFRT